MANNQKHIAAFQRYFPEKAVAFCYDIWQHYQFKFKITKARSSKLGDYRYDRRSKEHMITINHDLNPFSFLITYLHEVAHLEVQVKFGNNVSPHGNEWKLCFTRLLDMALRMKVFPSDVHHEVLRYSQNPKASTVADQKLYIILKKYNASNESGEQLILADILEGENFIFRNNTYKKIEKRRTRATCIQLDTGRKYYISEIAEVQRVS